MHIVRQCGPFYRGTLLLAAAGTYAKSIWSLEGSTPSSVASSFNSVLCNFLHPAQMSPHDLPSTCFPSFSTSLHSQCHSPRYPQIAILFPFHLDRDLAIICLFCQKLHSHGYMIPPSHHSLGKRLPHHALREFSMTNLPEGKSSVSSCISQSWAGKCYQPVLRKTKTPICCVCQFSQNNVPMVVNAKLTIWSHKV